MIGVVYQFDTCQSRGCLEQNTRNMGRGCENMEYPEKREGEIDQLRMCPYKGLNLEVLLKKVYEVRLIIIIL